MRIAEFGESPFHFEKTPLSRMIWGKFQWFMSRMFIFLAITSNCNEMIQQLGDLGLHFCQTIICQIRLIKRDES